MRIGDQRTTNEKILDEIKDGKRKAEQEKYSAKLRNMSSRELKYHSEPSLALYEMSIKLLIENDEYSPEEAEDMMFQEWALGVDDSETPKEKRFHGLRVQIAENYRNDFYASRVKSQIAKSIKAYQEEGLDLEQAVTKINKDALDNGNEPLKAYSSLMIEAIEVAKSDVEYREALSKLNRIKITSRDRNLILKQYKPEAKTSLLQDWQAMSWGGRFLFLIGCIVVVYVSIWLL